MSEETNMQKALEAAQKMNYLQLDTLIRFAIQQKFKIEELEQTKVASILKEFEEKSKE